MARWADGDAVAMRTLIHRFTPRLRGYFRKVSSDHLEDLVQQTFMKVHIARRHYRPGAPFRAWLFAIAANERIDAYRRSHRTTPSDELDQESDENQLAQDEATWRRELAHMLGEAVDALPIRQREVLHLHFVEGLAFADIARALGKNENAIKQCAFRAYSQLRTKLAHLKEEVGP